MGDLGIELHQKLFENFVESLTPHEITTFALKLLVDTNPTGFELSAIYSFNTGDPLPLEVDITTEMIENFREKVANAYYQHSQLTDHDKLPITVRSEIE